MIRATVIASLFAGVIASVQPTIAAPICPEITTRREMNVIIPAYIYPSASEPYATYWNRILQDAAIAKSVGFKLVVIVNPSNGDFTSEVPEYTAIIDRLDAAGVKIIGYVYSYYGTRPITEIKTNIAAYKSIYPKVSGIFIDHAQIDNSHFNYYDDLHRTTLQQFGSEALVVGNAPGQQLASTRHREIFDITVAFEDIGGHLGTFTQQGMVRYASPAQIGYIVNAVNQVSATDSQARACGVLKSLRYNAVSTRNAGYWYLTTDKGDNAYDTLGSAHDAFMQATCWANSLKACPN